MYKNRPCEIYIKNPSLIIKGQIVDFSSEYIEIENAEGELIQILDIMNIGFIVYLKDKTKREKKIEKLPPTLRRRVERITKEPVKEDSSEIVEEVEVDTEVTIKDVKKEQIIEEISKLKQQLVAEIKSGNVDSEKVKDLAKRKKEFEAMYMIKSVNENLEIAEEIFKEDEKYTPQTSVLTSYGNPLKKKDPKNGKVIDK